MFLRTWENFVAYRQRLHYIVRSSLVPVNKKPDAVDMSAIGFYMERCFVTHIVSMGKKCVSDFQE
jgi:hypothetical protein